jgi:hypothetical protein
VSIIVVLRPGSGTDVYLRPDRSAVIDVYLFAGSGNDVYLRREGRPGGETAPPVIPSFPTQYSGLRVYYHSAVNDLCLVAVADAPAGMGGVLKINKNGTDYAVYLVETSSPEASPIRVYTTSGAKAIRVKT